MNKKLLLATLLTMAMIIAVPFIQTVGAVQPDRPFSYGSWKNGGTIDSWWYDYDGGQTVDMYCGNTENYWAVVWRVTDYNYYFWVNAIHQIRMHNLNAQESWFYIGDSKIVDYDPYSAVGAWIKISVESSTGTTYTYIRTKDSSNGIIQHWSSSDSKYADGYWYVWWTYVPTMFPWLGYCFYENGEYYDCMLECYFTPIGGSPELLFGWEARGAGTPAYNWLHEMEGTGYIYIGASSFANDDSHTRTFADYRDYIMPP